MTIEEVKKDVVTVPATEGQATEAPAVETPQYTEIEQKAMEQGWKPQDQWEGNPEDHRSAKEFLDRGELLTKLKSQGTQIRELQQMMNHLSDHNKKVYKAGYETALRDFKAQRANALKEGDVDTALALEEKIDQTKDALTALNQQPQQVQQGPSPVYQDWLSKNDWYKSDTAMRHWANGMAVEYGKVNPGVTEQEVYEFLHNEARKTFPQRFKSVPRAPQSPEGSGRKATGTKGAGGSDEFEAVLSTMSELDAKIARSLVKNGHVKKEEYVAQYKATGGR